MVSPWKNPLPLAEYTAAKVVICAYQGTWVPITVSYLAEAIRLYQNALLYGEEIFVFPCELAPWSSNALDFQIPQIGGTTNSFKGINFS